MRDRMFITMMFGLCASLLLYGCATIVSGKNQQLSFQSTPDGVTVTVNGRIIGKTPVSTLLPKKSEQTIVFSKDGYQPITMPLTTHLDGWFWGNIVLGGLIGSTTDGITGAVNEYSPSQYYVTLQPINVSSLQYSADNSKSKVKDFIIVSYRSLSIDISQGKGEYLSSLHSLLKTSTDKIQATNQNLQRLMQQASNIPDFADRVIQEYMK